MNKILIKDKMKEKSFSNDRLGEKILEWLQKNKPEDEFLAQLRSKIQRNKAKRNIGEKVGKILLHNQTTWWDKRPNMVAALAKCLDLSVDEIRSPSMQRFFQFPGFSPKIGFDPLIERPCPIGNYHMFDLIDTIDEAENSLFWFELPPGTGKDFLCHWYRWKYRIPFHILSSLEDIECLLGNSKFLNSNHWMILQLQESINFKHDNDFFNELANREHIIIISSLPPPGDSNKSDEQEKTLSPTSDQIDKPETLDSTNAKNDKQGIEIYFQKVNALDELAISDGFFGRKIEANVRIWLHYSWEPPPRWRETFIRWFANRLEKEKDESLLNLRKFIQWMNDVDPDENIISNPRDLLGFLQLADEKGEVRLKKTFSAENIQKFIAEHITNNITKISNTEKHRWVLTSASRYFYQMIERKVLELSLPIYEPLSREKWRAMIAPNHPQTPDEILEAFIAIELLREDRDSLWQIHPLIVYKQLVYTYVKKMIDERPAPEWGRLIFEPQRRLLIDSILNEFPQDHFEEIVRRLLNDCQSENIFWIAALESCIFALGRKLESEHVNRSIVVDLLLQQKCFLWVRNSQGNLLFPTTRPQDQADMMNWFLCCWRISRLYDPPEVELTSEYDWLFPAWRKPVLGQQIPRWLEYIDFPRENLVNTLKISKEIYYFLSYITFPDNLSELPDRISELCIVELLLFFADKKINLLDHKPRYLDKLFYATISKLLQKRMKDIPQEQSQRIAEWLWLSVVKEQKSIASAWQALIRAGFQYILAFINESTMLLALENFERTISPTEGYQWFNDILSLSPRFYSPIIGWIQEKFPEVLDQCLSLHGFIKKFQPEQIRLMLPSIKPSQFVAIGDIWRYAPKIAIEEMKKLFARDTDSAKNWLWAATPEYTPAVLDFLENSMKSCSHTSIPDWLTAWLIAKLADSGDYAPRIYTMIRTLPR